VDARFSCWPRPERPFDYYSAARPFQLLYVSPLAPYKHQESVMRAVALLQADGVPVVLRLVGGGDRRRADQIRRRLAHSGEGAFIKYDGAVPHAELPQVYREADAFVFASTCECCPVTLGEAMSSGLPILCSDRPVIREMACDSGVYFEPEQPASIAAAIRRIVEDNELRAMSARRAFELSTCRTWDSHFEAIVGALTDLADFNMKVYSRN
jgi:glycosyltransferase involved in cell wall biosynthesis